MYRKGYRMMTVTDEIYQLLSGVDHNYSATLSEVIIPFPGYHIGCCHRCEQKFNKSPPQIPAAAAINNITVPLTPDVINLLSAMEVRMISRVTPFLKIFTLQRGREQLGIRGSVINFAQNIEEL